MLLLCIPLQPMFLLLMLQLFMPFSLCSYSVPPCFWSSSLFSLFSATAPYTSAPYASALYPLTSYFPASKWFNSLCPPPFAPTPYVLAFDPAPFSPSSMLLFLIPLLPMCFCFVSPCILLYVLASYASTLYALPPMLLLHTSLLLIPHPILLIQCFCSLRPCFLYFSFVFPYILCSCFQCFNSFCPAPYCSCFVHPCVWSCSLFS